MENQDNSGHNIFCAKCGAALDPTVRFALLVVKRCSRYLYAQYYQFLNLFHRLPLYKSLLGLDRVNAV